MFPVDSSVSKRDWSIVDSSASFYRKSRSLVGAVDTYAPLLYNAIIYHQRTGTPLKDCLYAAYQGIRPQTYFFLGIDMQDSAKYVTKDFFVKNNGNAANVLHDKTAIYSIFDDLIDHFPILFGTIHDGRYISRDNGRTQSLLEAVEVYDTLIVKPADKWQGKGVRKISKKDEWYINNEVVDVKAIEELQSSFEYNNYIVTDYLSQHPYSDKIFPDATNTIRLLTVLDPDTGDPQVVRAAHRFGTTESAPTDNWENGGVAAPIDHKSGKLRSVVTLDESGKRQRINNHPETDSRIAGVQIPMWEKIQEITMKGAASYPMARMIAWDIVVGSDQPMLLEASGNPGINTLQLEQGLLDNPVVKQLSEQLYK